MLFKSLAKKPEARISNMGVFAAALETQFRDEVTNTLPATAILLPAMSAQEAKARSDSPDGAEAASQLATAAAPSAPA